MRGQAAEEPGEAALARQGAERRRPPLELLRARLRYLYHGHTPTALRFQTTVILVDLAAIAFFIATPVLRETKNFLWVDYSVAVVLALDLAARALASLSTLLWLRKPTTIVDFVILATLLAPYTLASFAFLRILRLWTVSRSGVLWRPFRRRGLREWEAPGRAIVNLLTFLFVATGFVYTFFFRDGSGYLGYVDALYFTVATVTTTGFGDITLPGAWGKLTSIVTMIVGISLFVRLAQSIFRPSKIDFPCPRCALQRHEPDAVHCKACGYLLKIPDEDE